ncbi:hypothetical protein VB735_15160 [Halotia wernerae UHCC 0503]|nr:hypothetical protein [Halotia wernerae UHCC 0503]
MRASIRPHLQPYFKALQGQMECQSPTEALNHLLMDLKRRGYSFLEDYQYKPAMSEGAPCTWTVNDKSHSVYTSQQPQREPLPQNNDPYIRRLLEIGMEEF